MTPAGILYRRFFINYVKWWGAHMVMTLKHFFEINRKFQFNFLNLLHSKVITQFHTSLWVTSNFKNIFFHLSGFIFLHHIKKQTFYRQHHTECFSNAKRERERASTNVQMHFRIWIMHVCSCHFHFDALKNDQTFSTSLAFMNYGNDYVLCEWLFAISVIFPEPMTYSTISFFLNFYK